MTIPARCTILAVCMVLSVAEVQAAPEHQVVQEWRFSQEGDLLGWSAGGHIEGARVERGALRGRAVGWDPILLGPVFEIRSSPTQYVEIRMRCQQTGRGELFWTETLEGRYGGFSQEKSAAFSAVGDGQFHDYRVYPFWHAAGKVIRLRVDVPPDGEFEIEAIRVVDRAAGPPEKQPLWSMAADGVRWQPMQQIESIDVSPAGLAASLSGQPADSAQPDVRGERPAEAVCVRADGRFGRHVGPHLCRRPHAARLGGPLLPAQGRWPRAYLQCRHGRAAAVAGRGDPRRLAADRRGWGDGADRVDRSGRRPARAGRIGGRLLRQNRGRQPRGPPGPAHLDGAESRRPDGRQRQRAAGSAPGIETLGPAVKPCPRFRPTCPRA